MAYTFFNAMNSAGKKLSDYDLLKAHHLRHISNRSKIFHAATRWDYYDENEHRKILSHTLYRLRRWIRSEAPLNSPEESRQLFRHFSARPSCGIEIFYPDNEVRFNSTIRGGSIFFHYAEHYRAIMKEYQSTEGYKLLGHLYGHSGNVLHDAIESIHFLYYCKFQNNYLEDALFCIAHCVSQLRNESQIRRLYIEKPVFGNCVKELDAAVSPDQFFDWALSPENIYVPSQEGNTRKAYWQALSDLYKEISEYPLLTVSSHVKEKMELLKTN